MAEWKLEHLRATEPHEFEMLLSRLFSKMGYNAELTQYSRDRGIDLVIRIENFGLSHTWLVQAKRYSYPVGVKEIREYSSLKYRDRVDGVIIVATSLFTKEAIEEAATHNLKLINGELLVEMLDHYLPDESSDAVPLYAKHDLEGMGDVGSGTILKNNEKVLASESVLVGRERFVITLTNMNIFLKKENPGLFSKSARIEERIALKDILGIHKEPNRLILITGSRKLRMYVIGSRKLSMISELMEGLRPEYLKGEHIMISSRLGEQLTILTNKRLIITDIPDVLRKAIDNKRIVGAQIKGGFLKKDQLVISEDRGVVTEHHIDVDDPVRWKDMIEQCVRTS